MHNKGVGCWVLGNWVLGVGCCHCWVLGVRLYLILFILGNWVLGNWVLGNWVLGNWVLGNWVLGVGC